MILLLSTRNPGKIAEIRLLLSDLPIALRSVSEIDGAPFVEEDADTLEGNARKKAETLHAFGGLPALADDTGLEVDALGGLPGVQSARFAGLQADDAANRRKLLADLQAARDRSARFRTVIALADETGTRFFEGVCRGTIIDEERGSKGFGYDRIFVPEGGNRTFAELDAEEKNAISHRGAALRRLAAYLHDQAG
ncbi:MAG: RdgB/HAM1 family non-canonical purine NTP pyrophosphatase [Bacteroidetes bacterium SB0662_bin_6]|nr:RdgB/HAM1 family non-canonical purine NTP pyrophosphatase [Bacteroidetes bacterium SB0668_bin_1]MYE04582.1 RdgB/HAM1 family non-canonical purine NTP pyrophosphatase [Bacteroidetes bacterium SB0662_bin_6]